MLKDSEPKTIGKHNRSRLFTIKNALVTFPVVVTAALAGSGCQVNSPRLEADQSLCKSVDISNNKTLLEVVVDDQQHKLVVPNEYEAILKTVDSAEITIIDPQPERPLPTFSPDGSRIAYIKGGDLFVVNSDGSNLTRLTDHNSDEFDAKGVYPAWSPDQKVIGYIAVKGGSEYTRFVNLENGKIDDSKAPPTGKLVGISWAPSGKTYLFVTDDRNTDRHEVYSSLNFNFVNVENGSSSGTASVNEVPTSPYNVRLKWSEDSKSLTYGVCTSSH